MLQGPYDTPLSQSDTPKEDTRIATMPSQREQVIKQAHERIARIRSDLNAMDYFSSGTLLQRTLMDLEATHKF